MKGYIEREALQRCRFIQDRWGEWILAEDIINLPAADVRENIRGKWNILPENLVWNSDGIYRAAYQCSNCDAISPFDSNYCPNCGADMRDRPSVPFDEAWERLKNESAESREFFEAAERMAEEEQT